MAELTFQTISFQDKEDNVEVSILKYFSILIPKEEFLSISEFKITSPHSIEFSKISQEKAQKKFSYLLEKYLEHLKTKLTGNKAIYIHQNSGIPLIGNPAFGIVYRNSSIIEIKPVTSCNLDCIYCSVGEGLSSTKTDYVIEKDYLVEELNNLIEFVSEPVEIHIGVQGEPFFYGALDELLEDLQQNPKIYRISIDTNGTLLSKEKIDFYTKITKLQINFSLDAMDEEVAKTMAGTKNYKLKHILDMIRYSSEKGLQMVVAPVLVSGYNENEMEKIIQFIKTLPNKPILGIQNFLPYKTGRNPASVKSWPEFFKLLQELEKKYDMNLRLKAEDFNVKKTIELPKPFSINDEVLAIIKCPDRFPRTTIAVAEGRMISISELEFKKEKKDKQVKVKILRDKHNIFSGKICS